MICVICKKELIPPSKMNGHRIVINFCSCKAEYHWRRENKKTVLVRVYKNDSGWQFSYNYLRNRTRYIKLDVKGQKYQMYILVNHYNSMRYVPKQAETIYFPYLLVPDRFLKMRMSL